MTNLVSYTFPVSEVDVRIIIQDDQPWFVAKDVCNILGLSNPTVAIESLDDDERAKYSLGRQGEANIVNESGLYALIFKSRKPEAKKFRKWVTSEVLPAIRKHGAYIDRPEPITPAEKQLLKELVHKRAAQASGDLGKTIAEIWSRIHNKFRVNSYHELPRHRLADVIEYINAMRLAPHPDDRPISEKEYIQLRNAVSNVFLGRFFVEADTQWVWNRIRAIYGLQSVRQLPARHLPEVIAWLEQLKETNSRFTDLLQDVIDRYRKDVISQGAPWTPHLKRDYQKLFSERLPECPNWIEVAQKVQGLPVSA